MKINRNSTDNLLLMDIHQVVLKIKQESHMGAREAMLSTWG